MSTKLLFAAMALFAFFSIISFFHINSALADAKGINWLFISGGIVFGLIAVYYLYKINKQSGTGKPDR